MILPRIVSEVFEPNNKAPRNSEKIAILAACLKVMDRDPTDVEKLFATSFAPIPNPSANAISAPTTMR